MGTLGDVISDLPSAPQAEIQQMLNDRDSYYIVLDGLRNRFMSAGEVQTLIGITKRQLYYWESQWVTRYARETHPKGWRRYSISDTVRLRIVKELVTQGIILPEMLDWTQQAQIVESLLIPFSLGLQVGIALETHEGGAAFMWDEFHQEKLQELTSAQKMTLVLPLNALFEDVFKKLRHGNVVAHSSSKERGWTFTVNGHSYNFASWRKSYSPKKQ